MSAGRLTKDYLTKMAKKETIEKKKLFHKEYIKTLEFEEVRKAVLERDGYRCVCCGRTEKLVCHHTNYKHLGLHNQKEIDDCVTLCNHCHTMGIHKNPANIHWFSVEHPRNCDDLREVDGILVRSNGEDLYDAITFKKLKVYENKNRYNRRSIIIPGGGGKREFVYRIVAKAFPEVCGKWFEGCEVHHIDYNPENDRADNLQIMSKEEHRQIHNIDFVNAGKEANEKRIAQYTMSGNLVAVYKSSTHAAKAMNISRSAIANVTCGVNVSCQDFQWKSFEANEDIPEFVPPVKTYTERRSELSSKPVDQYDKKGNFIKRFSSIKEATNELGFKSLSSICNCLIGKSKSSGGFIWKYSDK